MSIPRIATVALLAAGFTACAHAQSSAMTFFVTSTNPGKGADFGGLAGADKHCQALAEAAGAKGREWRAYLSNSAVGGAAAVNARVRVLEVVQARRRSRSRELCVEKSGVLRVRDRKAVDRKRRETDFVRGPLVLRPVVAAHRERACGDRDHLAQWRLGAERR